LVCRTCGTEIADKAIICYRCGTATTEARYKPVELGPRRRRSSMLVAILILAAVLLLAWLWLRSRIGASTEYLDAIGHVAALRVDREDRPPLDVHPLNC
jgi:ferric-dicitrate binding protein FerR (iron transport regulator)